MNALNIPGNRLAATSRLGPGQDLALVRGSMVWCLLSYVVYAALLNGRNGAKQIAFLLAAYLAAYLAFAIATYVATRLRPAVNVSRTVLSTVVDAAAITGVLILAGNDGALFVGLYLFFIFGNLFTYGRFYLHLSQLLCIVGFLLVFMLVPLWGHAPSVALGYLVALIILPLYVSTIFDRVKAEQAKAVQALKECLERDGRSG